MTKIERPIIFSTESVRAILDGQKTQTRRAVKQQADDEGILPDLTIRPEAAGLWEMRWAADDVGAPPYCDGLMHDWIKCPFGIPGDRLWVRETYLVHECALSKTVDESRIYYKADHTTHKNCERMFWSSPMFMPRKFSRLTLEITDVRCERLKDISWNDCIQEGTFQFHGYIDEHGIRSEGKRLFAEMWNTINTKRGFGWDTNPWVWVIEFKRVEKEGNE